MRHKIVSRLLDVEVEHDVRILFAIESGSRAWGFASLDSDYDVRFIYAHRRDWYETINIENKRDVIEYPIVDEIDINGWDVRKALKLYVNSNPAFIEWLQSPIVYMNQGCLKVAAKSVLSEIYDPCSGWHHYRHMAKANTRNYLSREEVPLKKYLYVMRALLAARYVEARQVPPPLPIFELLDVVESDDVRKTIEDLIMQKRSVGELGTGAAIPVLNDFIEAEFCRTATFGASKPKSSKIDTLNHIFKKVLVDSSFYWKTKQ